MQFKTMLEIESRFSIRDELSQIQNNLEIKTKNQFYFLVAIIILLGFGIILVILLVSKSRLSRKLKISNQTKDKVFEIISHDLINPFNSILGFTGLLESQYEEGEHDKLKKSIAIVKATAEETYELTTKLLDWSRVQRNMIQPSPEILDINKYIQELYPIYDKQARRKDISLSLKLSGSSFVIADSSFVRTILSNLLTNAIKFTPHEGRIEISSSMNDSMLEISVADTGVGISKERIREILEEDTVASAPGTNNEKGTGIGLMVCKEFIKLCEGELYIESVPGKGSRFSFTLPEAKS
jgi:signal transduction histidine kinase